MFSRKLRSTFVALSLVLGSNATATRGPATDLHIVNKAVSPDGFSRQAVLAEGIFPGPLITGKKGDRFQINVIDQLTNATMVKSTTIHWHGLFQHGTNWADGAAFVTQCPIAPQHSFLYNFHVPDQAGTFWYHSHISAQYCDGLRGPLVVYDPEDPHAHRYDVDNADTVITLADWYHAAAAEVIARGTPPIADATLINGLGRYAGGPASPLAVISVQWGKRYRFRLVSISCDPNYVFSIDNHPMTVIEVDGVNSQPLDVDSIQIFAGQRYSFILNANQHRSTVCCIKNRNDLFRPVVCRGQTIALWGDVATSARPACFPRLLPTWTQLWNPNSGVQGFQGGIHSAILRYVGAPNVEPITAQIPSTRPLIEGNLRPLEASPAPGAPHAGGVDYALNLAFGINFTPPVSFTVNGVPFQAPSIPVLLQILSGARSAQSLLPTGSVYGLPKRSTIELTMPGGLLGGPHPIHLHGHSFAVVRSAGSSEYNYHNPIRRDVVSIGGPGDNVTIRFVTDNPGPWFLHCHINWHLYAGFAVVFAEDVRDVPARTPVPEQWRELCPTYDALPPSDQ